MANFDLMEGKKYQYQKEWEKYRAKRRFYWFVFSLYGILQLLFLLFRGKIITEQMSGSFFLYGIGGVFCLGLMFAILGFIGYQSNKFICPRCKNKFFTLNPFSNDYRCANCNLDKYEGSSYVAFKDERD